MTPRAAALGLAAAAALVLLLRALDAPAVSSFLLSQIIIAIGLIFDVSPFQLKE